jgi:hypothetical protein
MIWAGTERVGCARTWCPQGVAGGGLGVQDLAVCRYDPPGNVQGRHAENVFPLLRKEAGGLVVPRAAEEVDELVEVPRGVEKQHVDDSCLAMSVPLSRLIPESVNLGTNLPPGPSGS